MHCCAWGRAEGQLCNRDLFDSTQHGRIKIFGHAGRSPPGMRQLQARGSLATAQPCSTTAPLRSLRQVVAQPRLFPPAAPPAAALPPACAAAEAVVPCASAVRLAAERTGGLTTRSAAASRQPRQRQARRAELGHRQGFNSHFTWFWSDERISEACQMPCPVCVQNVWTTAGMPPQCCEST